MASSKPSNAPTNAPTRIYFSDVSLVHKIDFQENITLEDKTFYTRIYSSEGIFIVKNNKLSRLQIKDEPVENITVNNIDFRVDKSEIKYDVDCFQISPEHMSMIIYVYTYALYDESLYPFSNKVKLVVEKQLDNICACYFQIEDALEFNNIENIKLMLVTFLSALNLC
jgi:hypothetical protein